MTYTFLQTFPFLRILLPPDLLSWLVWLALLGAAAFVAWRAGERGVLWTRRNQLRLLALLVAVPLAFLLFAVRLPTDGALPIPDVGVPARGPLLAPLLAVPAMLALVWFGTPLAALVAGAAGLFLALWDTRSPFSPVEFSLLMAAFGFLRSQRYRTSLFSWLRQPLVAALALSILYPLLYIATAFFWVSSSSLVSFDFALSRVLWASLAVAAPLLLAAAGLQLALRRWPNLAPAAAEAAQPAPSERSLEARFLFALGPVALLAFIALGALTWWTAGRAASQFFEDRINNNLEIAADSVPFLLETGQNLILQMAADTRLADAGAEAARSTLQSHLSGVPYFEQISLVDTGGNAISGVPLADYSSLQPDPTELNAVSLAIQGVALQIVSVSSANADSGSAQLVFVAAVRNSNGQVRSVLVARTTLAANPFAQPIVQSLQSVNELGAQALLLDGEGRIVMAPFAAAILQPYNGQAGSAAATTEDVSPDGSRLLVRYQPVPGSSWAAVARWPARLSQQLALNIALPILGVLLLAALVAYVLLRASLRNVSGSLKALAAESERIAAGDLRASLTVKGSDDEVGRLGSAFEVMRKAVLSRSEETQRLLTLSQGLSSSLEVRAHIEPILEAALAGGASVARLVFLSENGGSGLSFGRGEGNERYEALDPQMLSLTQTQARVLLGNPARARLKVDRGTPYPGSVAAFALRDKKDQLGALWLAYDQPQAFADESVRYLETLASQASAAAANARQYVNARLGQQRLEAVLAADPMPTLLLDAKQNLVFVNEAAGRVLNIKTELAAPVAIRDVLAAKPLLALLRAAGPKPHSAEALIGGATYTAAVSPIWAGAELIGFSCTLKDVTRSKQLESARLEFLGTVGHDLQDPLELIRGYLSMLMMLGDLNEQQNSYVQKIERSVESMARLAASLLAADRLDEGAGGLQVDSFALADLLRAVVDEVAPQARQKKVDVVIEPAEGAEKIVQADRTLLQRALYNLVDNAVKFSPRGQAVHITPAYAGDVLTVAVRDHGAGIAPLDVPHIFDRPAGQAITSGLPIVRSITERHKGKAWAESDLGAGSTFYLQIPLVQR